MMINPSRSFVSGVLLLSLITAFTVPSLTFAVEAPAKPGKTAAKTVTPPEKPLHSHYETIDPMVLLKDPKKFLNTGVTFQGIFNSFSSLGLDYSKAKRESKDYVGLLLLRPDVEHHKIPLAELKLFYPRKKSEEVLHLESGDIISIRGSVFSAALNDPWVDVEEITVIKKINPESDKKSDQDCC